MAWRAKARHVAVRGQEFDPLRCAQRIERVERIQVVAHVAVGRVDHGGAAVEDVVAAEQRGVFAQAAGTGGWRAWPGVCTTCRVWVILPSALSSQREQLAILCDRSGVASHNWPPVP